MKQEKLEEKIGVLSWIRAKFSGAGVGLLTAAVLTTAPVYLGGCGDEPSECCEQLEEKSCNGYNDRCVDVSEYDGTYKSHLCIKNPDGDEYGEPTNLCCRCIDGGTPDPGSKY